MVDKYYYCRRSDQRSDQYQYYSNTNHHHHHQHPAAASFSSTLLDEIYRSIDNIDQGNMKKKQSSSTDHEEEIFIFQRAAEKWILMENKKNKKKKKKKVGHVGRSSWDHDYDKMMIMRPKPITKINHQEADHHMKINTKSAAGNYLQKKKAAAHHVINNKQQPISPGARLAGFFNSLFTKRSSSSNNTTSSSTLSPPNSSRSSCLSKTPSSRSSGKISEKRSVRFQDDEDHFQIKKHNLEVPINIPRLVIVEEEEAAPPADFLRINYHKNDFHHGQYLDQEFDSDDDTASYSSSDLFELDNLSADIGFIDRYRQELPVYETTHLHSNRPIATSGF